MTATEPEYVSIDRCPFPECRESISKQSSFAHHWPSCPVNPANGGVGAFPSERGGGAGGRR